VISVALKIVPQNETADIPEPIGVPASETHLALQTDAFKELINKLAWALGSTYRTPYNNTLSPTRQLAIKVAHYVLAGQGYPSKIRVTGP